MHVKKFKDATPYEAPNHFGVVGLRLQGFEEGGPTNQWVGLSQFLPGGGAGGQGPVPGLRQGQSLFRRGFGSRLIEQIVGAYFDGEGRIDFEPGGIRFRLTGKPTGS